MKHLAVLLLTAALSFGADFTTGQGARVVIGQATFTRQDPNTAQSVTGGVSGLAYANGRLVVADSNKVAAAPINNRVLLYTNLPDWLLNPSLEIRQFDQSSTADQRRCPLCGIAPDVVLGQASFTTSNVALGADGLRTPTAVATDGNMLVVSDTDNNRVLIWKSFPATNKAPADIVLGQKDFTGNLPNAGTGDALVPNSSSLRGPQGVWLQNGKLFVADDLNYRVLIWNSIPTSNYQAADVVLGQANFTTGAPAQLQAADPKANSLLNPVSVTSDGTRLYVTDLGHNRVLIWNTIPTQNGASADVVIGQPDFTSAVSNNTSKLCTSTGKDANNNDLYPVRCAATLDFPRFALSDGQKLFVADGGNDRVLVFNQIPTQPGMKADAILGQFDDVNNQNSDNANPAAQASADSVRSPMSLAWDGVNLYVSDPYDRRIMVFAAGDQGLPIAGVRNAAALEVYATGRVSFGGTVAADDETTITIMDKNYVYKATASDTLSTIIVALTNLVNAAPDPNVVAVANTVYGAVEMTARVPREDGNNITFTASVVNNTASGGTKINVVPNGPTLQGGSAATKIAPGTLITLLGNGLAENVASAAGDADPLPTELGNVQVYVDGARVPLLYVSPTQINAQMPYEVNDSNSVSIFVRTKRSSGDVTVTRALGVPIVPNNPAIFTYGGQDPRPGVILHGSGYATGTISVDGTANVGDTAKVTINGRVYSYTVVTGDTLVIIRDKLIALINQDPDVQAYAAGLFTRIRLKARVAGDNGRSVQYKGEGAGQVILSNTGSNLCCNNVAYSPVTQSNPAAPGETIILYGTGLGLVQEDAAKAAQLTGHKYSGPTPNQPVQFVYSTAAGKTANVLYAGLVPGDTSGLYHVELELNSDVRSDNAAPLTIAQDIYVSNIVTFPVYNPNPPAATTP